MQQYQYGNGINRDGQNELGSTKGTGSVSSGTQRGNNGGTVSGNSEKGKASRELNTKDIGDNNYTEEGYNETKLVNTGEAFMILNGEEYSKRLQSFSDSTAKLISEMFTISKEAAEKALDITSNSELSEEEVVRQLQELKNTYLMTKETK